MKLTDAAKNVLSQLSSVVTQLDDNLFKRPIPMLGDSTLGQHVRHTIEFFRCLKDGLSIGTINYDNRQRDVELEESPKAALSAIEEISIFIDTFDPSRTLDLEVAYDMNVHDIQRIKTNVNRELAYNIEHAVHHMAIIKIGLREVLPEVQIPDGFGIAVSTLRYRQEHLQHT